MDFSNKEVLQVNGKIRYICFKELSEYKDLVHAYTVDNNYSFRTDMFNSSNSLSSLEYQKSSDNYKILCQDLGIDYKNIVKVNQEHTANIVVIKDKKNKDSWSVNNEDYRNVDGLITNQKNVVLTTVSADCIILFMFDPVKKVIANIHSGWRGTLEEIGIKALKIMHKEFDCNFKDIKILFNPSILGDCFEVLYDVKEKFYGKFKYLDNIEKIIKTKNGKWIIDTVLLNKTLFLNIGVKESNLICSNICTKCNKSYMHSYRGSMGQGGLNTALIMLI